MYSFFSYQNLSQLLFWVGLVSLFLFIFSLLLIPFIIGRLPIDYFTTYTTNISKSKGIGVQALSILIIKNAVGYLLLLAGILMLFLPGQGLFSSTGARRKLRA